MASQPPYKLEVAAPVFAVTDLRRSVAYYTDALLFSTGFQWSDEPDEPVRYAIMLNGNTELHLSEAPKSRPAVAYFFVDGVEAYYRAVTAGGHANITCELEDQPWEMREFEVADPDGNRIIFGEHLSRFGDTDQKPD